MKMKLQNGNIQRCYLHYVLFVPKLAYNLLSVSKAAEARKTPKLDKNDCQILSSEKNASAFTFKSQVTLYYSISEKSSDINVVYAHALFHFLYYHFRLTVYINPAYYNEIDICLLCKNFSPQLTNSGC